MPLSPEDKFGPYTLLSPLGEGGMGMVWKARDTRLDRVVALKVAKATFSERFEREARAVAALNHPNICTLHDVGPNYLVMEWVDGAPLKGPMPVAKAIELAGQILDALDAAHRKGITHRDLKPANIMLGRQGIKLLDFGLAKQSCGLKETDETLTAALTGQGQIIGTLQYMAPEQLQGREADARSDIFAFGCVLYEMLSGKRAFDGASAASVIAAVLEREPAPLQINAPLERVIRKCLAKDPDERFQNARDLKYNLGLATEQYASTSKTGKFGPWPWILACIATAISLAIGIAHFMTPQPAAPLTAFTVFPEEKTSMTGQLAVSPDGRHLAFAAHDSTGTTSLWVRGMDSAETRRLPGTEGASYPGWSNDGRWVAFQASYNLKKIDVATGQIINLSGAGSSSPRPLLDIGRLHCVRDPRRSHPAHSRIGRRFPGHHRSRQIPMVK